MTKLKRQSSMTSLMILTILMLVITACGSSKSEAPKTYTVGIYNIPLAQPMVVGFKAELAERGYIEGENITYLQIDHNGQSAEEVTAVLQSFVDADADLIFASARAFAQVAQVVIGERDIPLVFGMCGDPVSAGLVDSIEQPGDHTTGISCTIGTGATEGRRLELLLEINPGIQRIFTPYNSDDPAMTAIYGNVLTAASNLGIEVVTAEYHSPEEFLDVLTNIPADVDAYFAIADTIQGVLVTELISAATASDLGVSGPLVGLVSAGVLSTYGPDYVEMGHQIGRQADQIFQGTDAGVLPVEWGENRIGVNLEAAEVLGIVVPDAVLEEAHLIYRGQAAS